jgi:hypothetical protein
MLLLADKLALGNSVSIKDQKQYEDIVRNQLQRLESLRNRICLGPRARSGGVPDARRRGSHGPNLKNQPINPTELPSNVDLIGFSV